MATAEALARSWRRSVPAGLKALLDSRDLAALSKKKFTLHYAGEHRVSARFDDDAFEDLAGWMEDVGLGSDIDWPNETGAEYRHALPLAVVVSKELGRELLAVRTDDPQLPVLLWTEGTFFPIYPSLHEFLGELRGTREDPIVALRAVIAAAGKKDGAGDHRGAAELLEEAIARFGPTVLAARIPGQRHASTEPDAPELIGIAHNDAGVARFALEEHAAAEKHYEAGAGLGCGSSARNLMVMAAETDRDWRRTLARADAYFDKHGFSDAIRIEIASYRVLAHAMLGDIAAATSAIEGVRAAYSGKDDFEKTMAVLASRFDGVAVPSRARPVLDAIAAAVEAWRRARVPGAGKSPREWWNALDEVWRVVLRSNKGKRRENRQVKFDADLLEATDDELARILELKLVEIHTIAKPNPGSRLGSYLTPETLAPLARLAQLEQLDAKGAREPYALAPLAGLSRLRVLNLDGTKTEDLAPIANHPEIEDLNIRDTGVTDLRPVATLRKLRRFGCWRTPVADLAPLAACTELRELIAGNTQVRKLAPLPELTKLEHADFSFARFDQKDLGAFKKAHPKCRVEYSKAR